MTVHLDVVFCYVPVLFDFPPTLFPINWNVGIISLFFTKKGGREKSNFYEDKDYVLD